jgi:hypothetical protein
MECHAIQNWLNAFECERPPKVILQPSYETVSIRNFPLPSSFKPDYLDIALEVKGFPADPPKGAYILINETNRVLISSLQRRFNIFHEKGFHGACSINGFEWICIGYLKGWKYNASQPHKGDNIQKMLGEFWRLLDE